MNNDLYGLETAVTELCNAYDRDRASLVIIKDTSRAYVSFSSIALPLLSVVHQINPGTGLLPDAYRNPLMLGAIGLYIALMLICVIVLMPADMWGPLEFTQESIQTAYDTEGKSREQILREQIGRYLRMSGHNSQVISRLAFWSKVTGILLMVNTALLITLL